MKRIDDRWEDLCKQLDVLSLETMEWLDSPIIRKTITSPLAKNTQLHIYELNLVTKAFGKIDGWNIVEFGGGYGNACKVFQELANIDSYTLVDTPQMLRLAQRFLDEYKVEAELITCYRMEQVFDKEYDLFFAATCLSEMPLEYRQKMVDNLWPKCKRLFITNADQQAHPELDGGTWDNWLEGSIEKYFKNFSKQPFPKHMESPKHPYHWVYIAW
jgi:hypothetical protein